MNINIFETIVSSQAVSLFDAAKCNSETNILSDFALMQCQRGVKQSQQLSAACSVHVLSNVLNIYH